MSFKVEVQTKGDDAWTPNGLRFEEKDEAERYARDLERRWTLVTAWRVVECEDEVNAWFNGDVHLELKKIRGEEADDGSAQEEG